MNKTPIIELLEQIEELVTKFMLDEDDKADAYDALIRLCTEAALLGYRLKESQIAPQNVESSANYSDDKSSFYAN